MWGFAAATDRRTKFDRWVTWIQRRGRVYDLTPRRVTLVYLVFGLAALLGSDVLLVQLVPEPRLSQLQALKGGVEVLVTGGLIYALTRGSRASLHRTNSRLDAARRELGVLHRVLRHNLRNDLTVILGYANQIETCVADPDVETYCERITATCNEFVRSADKTKHLAELHANGLRTTDVDLATILDRIRTDGLRRYPRATIEVEQPEHPVV